VAVTDGGGGRGRSESGARGISFLRACICRFSRLRGGALDLSSLPPLAGRTGTSLEQLTSWKLKARKPVGGVAHIVLQASACAWGTLGLDVHTCLPRSRVAANKKRQV
jgi:hypothetical protein